jgi:hypothetical protein
LDAVKQALARAANAEKLLATFDKRVNRALQKDQVPQKLTIDTAILIEHLRAALDYIAGHVYRISFPNLSRSVHVYFPMVVEETTFQTGWLRDLRRVRPDLAKIISSLEGEWWLHDLKTLSNMSKHVGLVSQKRGVSKVLVKKPPPIY